MLARLIMELENENGVYASFQKSSVFQSVMMEKMDREYAEKLHAQGINPYSQYAIRKSDKNYWVIQTLSKEAYKQIIQPLLDPFFTEIEQEKGNVKWKIVNKQMSTLAYKNFLHQAYYENSNKIFKLKFMTPTAFKSDERYMNYPSIRWIYGSLLRKHTIINEDDDLMNEEILEELCSKSEIIQYNLKSVSFSIRGAKIPSFLGEIMIKVTAPQTLVNLINLLLEFGTYSGVGIKSGMGMGQIEIVER